MCRSQAQPVLILQTGDAPEMIHQRHGNFNTMFLTQSGLTQEQTETVHLPSGMLPRSPKAYCGVIITGSPAMVTEKHSWSEAAAGWLRNAMDDGLPVYGACYGHQLMAYAFGGEVGYHPEGLEAGTLEITLTDAARQDNLLGTLPSSFMANLTHYQSVLTPPKTAQILARSRQDAHQCLRYGPNAFSTQFHPEFTGAIMRSYLEMYAERFPEKRAGFLEMLKPVSDTPFSLQILKTFVQSLLLPGQKESVQHAY